MKPAPISDRLLRPILDAFLYGITVQNASGDLVYMNQAAAQLMGFSSQKTPLRKGADGVRSGFLMYDAEGNHFPADRLPGRLVIKTHTPHTATIRFRKPPSTKDHWTLVTAVPVFTGDTLEGVVNVLHDYTKHARSDALHKQVQEHENTLRMALDVANMGVWDWEIPGNTFSWSDGTKPRRSLTRGNKQGTFRQFLNHIHVKDREAVRRVILDAGKKRGKFEAEFRIPGRGKSHRWMLKRGEILTDKKGRPARMIGVGMDSTRQKKMEAELAEGNRKFRAVFNSTNVAMFITDTRLRILESNTAASRLFFPSLRSLSRLGVPEEVSTLNGDNELIITTKEGVTKTLEYRVHPSFLPGKHLFVFHDITSRADEDQRREHLLGIASHELRTPLASIKAFIALLKRKYLKKEYEGMTAYIEKIDETSDSVVRLVNDFLDIARIRENRLELYREQIDLNTLVRELAADLQLTIPTHTLHVRGTISTPVEADRQRISQVLINIIKNAVKYSPDADSVIIRLSDRNGSPRISIRDFGIGIEKSEQKKIFRMYYKVHAKSHKRIYGLGAGLFIARTIMERHNGSIKIQSKPGEGSTFHIDLPISSKP